MTFMFNDDIVRTIHPDDLEFYYDITDGGYLVVEKLLVHPVQIAQVNQAIAVLKKLERELLQRARDGLNSVNNGM